MKKSESRYQKLEKDEQSVALVNRSISPIEVINLRSKDISEIPYKEIEESNAKIIALGFNKITKIVYFPEKLIKLELKCNLISKIQNLENCIFLQILDLSSNRISRIENLHNNIFITELHLGDNQIKTIENLEVLKDLKRLNIENNLLSSTSSIRTLSLNTKLIFIVLKGNPLALQGKYKPTIITLLPKLLYLDYCRLSQGFKKLEKQAEFFSKPFLENDVSIHDQCEIIPKISTTVNKKSKKIERPFFTETQKGLKRADAQVQTFNEDSLKSIPQKTTDFSREIKMPQYKGAHTNEMGKIRKYFKSVNLFKDYSGNFIETLIKSSEFKAVQESEIIAYAETIIEKIVVVIKGNIQYASKSYPAGSNLFSESLVIPEEIESDVICSENSEIFVLTKAELEKLFRLYPTQRELLMKNYLEKYVNPADFENKLKTQPKKNFAEAKKNEKFKGKSKSLSKLNLKSLISSRTSKDLGIISPSNFPVKDHQVSIKVQKEIEDLFKSADPFDFSIKQGPETKAEDLKYAELAEKIENLFEVYKKDIQLIKSRNNIEEEAKEFLKNGFTSKIELIAMERESFKKIINSCVIDEEGENLWMYEYVKSLDRASEDIKNVLALKSAEVREEIFSCQSALQTFLNQSSQSLSATTIKNYQIILNDCDLFKIYEDPSALVNEICGSYYSNSSVKHAADEIVGLMVLANKLKEALAQVIKAQESDDTQQLILVRQHLQDEGLLLSQNQDSLLQFEKSI